jgi:exopolysaccharide production protein ExoQ
LVAKGMELPSSWAHRVAIWHTVSDKVVEAPIIGHGFRASRAIKGQVDVYGAQRAAVPLHPHNAVLQIWLELGLLGVLIMLGLWWQISQLVLKVYDEFGRHVAGVVQASISSAVAISLVSFGFWQTWWQSVLAITTITLALYIKSLRTNASS